ncbi:Uncharacterised protein [uncultured archaeon]|nr:Uncharacterised protein [uncultured archaeon]
MAKGKLTETQAMEVAYNALSVLEKEEQARAMVWLQGKLSLVIQSPTSTGSISQNQLNGLPQGAITAKSFIVAKKPVNDIERVLCLAYFLAQHKNTPHFKTVDITNLNTEAARPKFSNTAVPVDNAIGKGYLATVGKGQKQITSNGEALVEALPDRDKVKAVIAELRTQRRRKKGTKKSKK